MDFCVDVFLLIWMTFFCFNDTVSIVHPFFLKVLQFVELIRRF